MGSEAAFRSAFLALLLALMAMRVYFMIKVKRSGGRLMPDTQEVAREGGNVVYAIRVILFIGLLAFLALYFTGAAWIDDFSFHLPVWMRWSGFGLGIVSVIFWSCAQISLDIQWSAQLQLKQNHHLVTTGPYARIRHPLYSAMLGWSVSLILLTANWIFTAVCLLSIAGIVWRVPKEEQMMIEAFGEEYQTYMQRTGRFFPRI